MSDAKGFATGGAARMLTPGDIQQKEFRVSRFGGYKMRDVDEFLDELTDSLSALVAEVERLRAHAGSPPVVGAPDLDDTARQADEIIERAREQAARIVGEAREGSAMPVGAAASAPGRAAVGGFLAEEREFLQSLAALVQRHAETVKGMARAARAAPTAEAVAAQGPSEPTAPAEAESSDRSEGSERSESSTSLEPSEDNDATSGGAESSGEAAPDAPSADTSARASTIRIPTAETPMRVEEPSPAAASRPESAPRSDADTGSLRELFWGEE
jgi:DivIVA domain-containing protein